MHKSADARSLEAGLTVPPDAGGVVLFAHGSGSGRHSPRNQAVAQVLHEAGLASLLFDLLSPEEAADRRNVFDIPLLAARLLEATAWCRGHEATSSLAVGYFGASTGAAAALWAAAESDTAIGAVVSRGGRPDLAAPRLGEVRAPTLLLVGSRDIEVLRMNRAAQRAMAGDTVLEVVPGASHLFEEPGTLDRVAARAAAWFTEHLA